MFYLDTSALTKLVLDEPESAELRAFLEPAQQLTGSELTSSELARAELPRAVLRRNPAARGKVDLTLSMTNLLSVTAELLARAGYVQPVELRSLDAIHLVSALSIRQELDCVIAYDRRLLDAASALGLPVASPGIP